MCFDVMQNMCLVIFGIWNHCSNAVKFTHDGKVGINLHLVDKRQAGCEIQNGLPMRADPTCPNTTATENTSASPRNRDTDTLHCSNREDACQNGISSNENFREYNEGEVFWLRCDVYDTGIGIPGFFSIIIFCISHLTEKPTISG
jgi:signal transduction histidine kinase